MKCPEYPAVRKPPYLPYFICVGDNKSTPPVRPSQKELYNHVSLNAATKWRELGVQLLGNNCQAVLRIIEKNYPHDAEECCKRTLDKWLETKDDASWDQLIKALQSSSVQLNYLASQINQMLEVRDITRGTQFINKDELINCKLADLEIVTYGDTAGGIQSHFADQFIAPEVRQQAIYDCRADTFSLGALFLQVLQRNYPVEERHSIPEWEIPHHNEAISVPDSELHYLGSLVKQCCQTNPDNRPDLHMVVQQLCDPVNQLVMGVTTLCDSKVTCACIFASDVWLCCQGVDGAYVSVFSMKNLEMEKKCFIEHHQICYMFFHHDQVWATSILAGRKGALLKIENKEDNYTHSAVSIHTQVDGTLSDGDYGTSLACSDTHVYVGTANGWCLKFDLNPGKVPVKENKLSSNPIRSLVIIKSTSLLWVSAGDQILFVNLEDLEFDKDKKGINADWRVGMFYPSPDEEIVWTAHVYGHSISAWNSQEQTCICNFSSHVLLGRQPDQSKSRISCASVAMDTLWVGLISGHIIVVSATFPQNLLTVMKPYHQSVQFLVPLYGVDNNMTMLSIGKGYKGHDQSNAKHQLGVVVWEVVTAKYTL